MEMSYRHVWDLIKEAEKHLEEPVIKTQKGEKYGGKSEVTSVGLSLLASYKRLKNDFLAKICLLKTVSHIFFRLLRLWETCTI